MMRKLLILTLLLLMPAPAARAFEPVTGSEELTRQRAARREAMRAVLENPEKAEAPARFGLLVIPVDFADARLPADWNSADLSARLVAPGGQSLQQYFRVASRGRLDLDIILAPPVHLPEDRRQYSDRDLNGFTRTRRLATEAITAARDAGVILRRLDNDGPDGVAGSADDDGQVDGVLILHAAPGTENDPLAGFIQPLQFFLADPVEQGGVTASSYAVASLQSGPGIWAHETGHLLGLEDRYDPLLAPGGAEVLSRGGLGVFSLMAAGAWGTGDGWGPSLPDAYSLSQLGWCEVRHLARTDAAPDTLRPVVAGGEAGRAWTRGETGPEFFLFEFRDRVAAAPFDAAVPAGGMVVYHVDETIPEGSWEQDAPFDWHLRVGVVEADGSSGLADGDDAGAEGDLFPGTSGAMEFGPFSSPGTLDHGGFSTGVAISGIAAALDHITFDVLLDDERSVDFTAAFGAGNLLEIAAVETGAPIGAMRIEVRATSTPAHGYFAATTGAVADVALERGADGTWRPSEDIAWVPFPDLPAGAATDFQYRFYNATLTFGSATRTWVWNSTPDALDFGGTWPGAWTIAHPGGDTGTTWHRWQDAAWAAGPVLACTGASFADGSSWPAVAYTNGGHASLTSAELGPEVRAVRLLHAIDVELLRPGVGMDGAVVRWVGPDGDVVAAAPWEGFGGAVATGALNPLHGKPAFVGEDLPASAELPLWRVATLPVPGGAPGPWRLRLEFAANGLWRAGGWFIGGIETLSAAEAEQVFAPRWGSNLEWTWPWPGAGDPVFEVQARTGEDASWVTVLESHDEPVGPRLFGVPGPAVLAALPAAGGVRHQIRVLGPRPEGKVASAALVVYPDGDPAETGPLGFPTPNPAVGEVRLLVDVPTAGTGILAVYDLRGRLVHRQNVGPGRQVVAWPGIDDAGRRLPAGLYFIRLEGSGPVTTRKVVLLR